MLIDMHEEVPTPAPLAPGNLETPGIPLSPGAGRVSDKQIEADVFLTSTLSHGATCSGSCVIA